MPRYFFDIASGSEIIEDREGIELIDDHAAVVRALTDARVLFIAMAYPLSDFVMQVRDEGHRPIYNLPIALAWKPGTLAQGRLLAAE